ncbi:arylesterase [Magnetospirillum sp. 64-120]|uniref:arylesterase n=1 Tax=Magnetospirillum sp. 64-120 TaxID=1895778 RepID=UPI000925D637|nr:arylesterase [Magnetospirillum sp. 64-120]OJX81787.1 MAG: arylesterase [Magnetospirillum sp. 64-120]
MAALVNASTKAAAPVTLLALGDSLTAGYGLPATDSFPSQLQKALQAKGRAVRVVNAGVSGDTSAGGLARLDWALADKPQTAIVALGANDGLRGLDPAKMEANLDAIVTKLQNAGVKVLLAGMEAPPNLGPDYGQAFRGAYARVAERRKVAFYPFFLDGVAANPALNQKDGLHPTAQGVAIIVGRMMPTVEKLLDQVRP